MRQDSLRQAMGEFAGTLVPHSRARGNARTVEAAHAPFCVSTSRGLAPTLRLQGLRLPPLRLSRLLHHPLLQEVHRHMVQEVMVQEVRRHMVLTLHPLLLTLPGLSLHRRTRPLHLHILIHLTGEWVPTVQCRYGEIPFVEAAHHGRSWVLGRV